ncbi:MAG: RNA polymerase-binding protein DksA, partial [Kiloniellales bacterium]
MSSTLLPPNYRPSRTEPFMSPLQREYFRQRLLRWREELVRESSATIGHLQQTSQQASDLADRAALEAERALELRTRDRERKLIAKIDTALRRIDEGSYGYCEETSEPISLSRLEARLIAT